jgi:hypothetical protein
VGSLDIALKVKGTRYRAQASASLREVQRMPLGRHSLVRMLSDCHTFIEESDVPTQYVKVRKEPAVG